MPFSFAWNTDVKRLAPFARRLACHYIPNLRGSTSPRAISEIDPRAVGQLKDRALVLVSPSQLFVNLESGSAQELVAMAREWIRDPKPEQYDDWETQACQIAQELIRQQRMGPAEKSQQQSVSFAGLEAAKA